MTCIMLSPSTSTGRRALGDLSNTPKLVSSPNPKMTPASTKSTQKAHSAFRGSSTVKLQQPLRQRILEHTPIAEAAKINAKIDAKAEAEHPAGEGVVKQQDSAKEDAEMPSWLMEAESILAGRATDGDDADAGDDAASRVALSWLGAGVVRKDASVLSASLCIAEMRALKEQRSAAASEERSLRAEVCALQARQAAIECQGEAQEARRGAAARLQQAEAAQAEAEAALATATSELQQLQTQLQEQRAERDGMQRDLEARAAAAEAGRGTAEAQLAELEALAHSELSASERTIGRLDALRKTAERERDTALRSEANERRKAGELQGELAALRAAAAAAPPPIAAVALPDTWLDAGRAPARRRRRRKDGGYYVGVAEHGTFRWEFRKHPA